MRTLLAWGLLAALALPARADIVDSGSLTIGGQGVIGGTFTVQGNALGVAGSISATSATLSGSGAQVYSLTTSSGIHMVNGILKFESGTMIQWADGSVSTTGVPATAVGASSAIFFTAGIGSWSNTVFSACIANSSLTITTSGGDVLLSFNGAIAGGGNSQWVLGFMEDGQFLSPWSSTLGVTEGQIGPGAQYMAGDFGVMIRAPTAGSHTYCLVTRVVSGSCSVPSSYSQASWSAKEIK